MEEGWKALEKKPGSKAALKRSTGKERRTKRQERSISSKNAISHNITCPHALANMQSGHWPSIWSTEFVFMTLTTIWPLILYVNLLLFDVPTPNTSSKRRWVLSTWLMVQYPVSGPVLGTQWVLSKYPLDKRTAGKQLAPK